MSCHCAADWPASRPSFSPIKISGPFSFLEIYGFYRSQKVLYLPFTFSQSSQHTLYHILISPSPFFTLLVSWEIGALLSRWVRSFRGVLLFVTSVVLHCT